MAITLLDFVKFYPLRAKGLAWLFGAGSSVAAGVPSAYELTWDFKKIIYCAEQYYPVNLYNNLDQGLKEQIQNYFDAQANCPPLGSPKEYSYYFERAYSSARDRSEYIMNKTSGMQLSYGHKVIGILLKNAFINLIFTTNFDKAFENVANSQFRKLEHWYSADLDNGDSGAKFFLSGKRPMIVKLHGDYFSDNLKNTTNELKGQDEKLRNILSLTLDTNGLCIMGYSGRDQSVMNVLFEAAKKPTTFSNGLFWFIQSGSSPLPEVLKLVEQINSTGKQAEIVEIDNFDIAWLNIVKGFDNLPIEDTEKLKEGQLRTINSPLFSAGKKYPLIRLNAIPIKEYPAIARLYKCNAGNTKEVIEYISKGKLPLFAIRKKLGIVGFGSDNDFKEAFKDYGEYELDLFQITQKNFIEDTAFKGLITAVLLEALTAHRPFRTAKRRDKYLLFPDPKKLNEPLFKPIKDFFGQISGNIAKTKLTWVIALEVNIQLVLGELLLLLSPTIIASKTSEKTERSLVSPFIKEFTARWYNQKYDEILNIWIKLILDNKKEIIITTLNNMSNSGVNATFKINSTTAFTRTN